MFYLSTRYEMPPRRDETPIIREQSWQSKQREAKRALRLMKHDISQMERLLFLLSIFWIAAVIALVMEWKAHAEANNAELMSYLQLFDDTAGKYDEVAMVGRVRATSIPIEFVMGQTDFEARCRSNYKLDGTFVGPSKIEVTQHYWLESTPARKEQAIMHELGHCILNRDHTQNPNSIMQTTGVSDEEYLSRRDSFLRELFINRGR